MARKRWNEHNACGRALKLLRKKGKKACNAVYRLQGECFHQLYKGDTRRTWTKTEARKQYAAVGHVINHTCDMRAARYGTNTYLYPKDSRRAARLADESLKGARKRKRRRR